MGVETLQFDNGSIRALPRGYIIGGELVDGQLVGGQLVGGFWTETRPTPLTEPRLLAVSEPALALLGLTAGDAQSGDFIEACSGGKPLKGSQATARCYCSYQFSLFAGQSGDRDTCCVGSVCIYSIPSHTQPNPIHPHPPAHLL